MTRTGRLLGWALSLAVLAVVVAIGAAGLAVYHGVRATWFPEPPAPVATTASEAPWTVLRTPGGLLEVAVIRAPGEVMERADTAQWGPFSLGTNVSRIRVAATYRYHIPLAPEWKVVRQGDQFIVVAPRVRPSLPVAFDTASLHAYTEAGWLRFDTAASQAALQKTVTAELDKRAGSPGAIEQQRETARRTVAEFVAKWLITQSAWKGVTPAQVRVVFADEPVERLGGAALTFSGL